MKKVKCNHCGSKYDLGNVKVIARYSDCTVFESPCCHRQVDDRPWKSLPDFTEMSHLDTIDETIRRGRLERERLEKLRHNWKG